MLVASKRYSQRDLDYWRSLERTDAIWATINKHKRAVTAARHWIERFTAEGSCYTGVSWGKDSVVVAALSIPFGVPLVHVRVRPIANPDNDLVRDEFLRMFPTANYHEIDVNCTHDAEGWHASGTLERGFTIAAEHFGDRHVSGIRAEESGARKLRMNTYGANTLRTCAPIGRWSAADVFAFLFANNLPVHPAYACSMGGMLERDRIRVASLGGKRGQGWGRYEWEAHYYREETQRLERV